MYQELLVTVKQPKESTNRKRSIETQLFLLYLQKELVVTVKQPKESTGRK